MTATTSPPRKPRTASPTHGIELADGATNTLRTRASFLREFVRNPRGIGAVAPSSRYLARRMLEGIDLSTVKAVAEFGPGTGAFTGVFLERLPKGCRFFAVEQSSQMAATLRRRFPGVEVHERSAARIDDICREAGITELDYVFSGLPWSRIPDSVQDEILMPTVKCLRRGGQFRTFAYPVGMVMPDAWRFRRRLGRLFSTVERSRTVWRNVPPAFVYRCTK